MARKKEITYLNGALKGELLDEATAEKLDQILALQESNGCIDDIKHTIYDMPPEAIEEIIATRGNESVDMVRGSLDDGQTLSVAYMFYARRLVLGDSVGMGKTVEISSLLNLLDIYYGHRGIDHKFLILTEKDTLSQFYREIIRFTGNFAEKTLATQTEFLKYLDRNDMDDLPSTVAPHSLFTQAKFQELVGKLGREKKFPFHTLIVDEGGILTNTATERYKAAKILSNYFENVIILNATAFESNLMNFFGQLNYVDDTYLPTKTDFQDRYCVKKYKGKKYPTIVAGEYKNAKEFRELVRYRYFKRTRRESGGRYEGNTGNKIILKRSKLQNHHLARTSMPGMVYDNPCYFDQTAEFNGENVPKAGKLLEMLTTGGGYSGDWKSAETVLVFCHYKEAQLGLQEYLYKNGISSRVLNGDTPYDEREQVVQGFKRGEFRVLITNVMKGLNFGHCNHTVLYSISGSIDKMVQFEGRYTRSFDIVGKNLAMLVMEGGENNKLENLLEAKAKASKTFAGHDYSLVLEMLTGEE